MQEGPPEVAAWERASARFLVPPPKSQLARSLSLGDFMCQTAYPPQSALCRNAAVGRVAVCK